MVTNQKRTGTAITMPAGLALGAAVSLVITIGAAAIIALLIQEEIIPESAAGYGVMILLLLAATAGTATANRKIKRRKLLVTALSAAVYYAILLSITALFFGGQYHGMGVTALLVLCGSALQLFTGQQSRGGQKRKHYKIHSR